MEATNGSELHYLILLGGNLGNVRQAFERAMELLGQTGRIGTASAVYCSKAWGFEASEVFYNQIVEVITGIEPEEMLNATQRIELQLGRTAKSHNGHYESRPIDIDILFCNNLTVSTPRLTIPHPLLHRRRFTLVPLVEQWADLVHPLMGKTARQLLDECTDSGEVWRN